MEKITPMSLEKFVERYGLPYRKYVKTDYVVHVRRGNPGETGTNKLENEPWTVSKEYPFIITGTAGETYVSTMKSLCKGYTHNDGTPITEYNIPEGEFEVKAIPGAVFWAVQTEMCIEISTARGTTQIANRPGVDHGNGDLIGTVDPVNRPIPHRVVNGALRIYELADLQEQENVF